MGEKSIDEMSGDELNNLKIWLFRENVRIQAEQKELEEYKERLMKERKQFRDEMDLLNHKIVLEKKRLKEDRQFFDKKMEILKDGFVHLDADRKKLEYDRKQLENEKVYNRRTQESMEQSDVVEYLFRGVNCNNPLALKKRYKDLIKIFHPDNLCGDLGMVQKINKEYERLKREYDYGRQA